MTDEDLKDYPVQGYRVTWTIELDATSPEVAAELAREIMRDEDSIATIFEVGLIPVIVDLGEI